MEALWQHTEQPIYCPKITTEEDNPEEPKKEKCKCYREYNRLIDQLSPPVFLRGSLNKMMKLRERKIVSKLLTK